MVVVVVVLVVDEDDGGALMSEAGGADIAELSAGTGTVVVVSVAVEVVVSVFLVQALMPSAAKAAATTREAFKSIFMRFPSLGGRDAVHVVRYWLPGAELGAELMSDAGAEAGGGPVSAAAEAVESVMSFFLQPPTASALAATATTNAVFQLFIPGSFEVP